MPVNIGDGQFLIAAVGASNLQRDGVVPPNHRDVGDVVLIAHVSAHHLRVARDLGAVHPEICAVVYAVEVQVNSLARQCGRKGELVEEPPRRRAVRTAIAPGNIRVVSGDVVTGAGDLRRILIYIRRGNKVVVEFRSQGSGGNVCLQPASVTVSGGRDDRARVRDFRRRLDKPVVV